MLNLAMNAMEAMARQSSEKRRLNVRTGLNGTGKVEFAISDSGHGIEPEKMERLFEPFFTTKPNGMGMGLSIARRIIEAHQGRISAENNAGGGTTFRVVLPVQPGQGSEFRVRGDALREAAPKYGNCPAGYPEPESSQLEPES
jgi:signal transduction histidine kinase